MSKLRWIWPALVVLAAAGGFLIGRRGSGGASEDPRIAQLSARVHELEARSSEPQSNARLPGSAPPSQPAPARRTPECPSAGNGSPADSQIQQIREQLAASRESAAELRARVSELEQQVEQATVEQRRLSSSEAELKAALASANQAADAAQAELKSRSERTAELEKAFQKLRDKGEDDSRKLSQIAKATAELQDLSRRRENALAAVLRRYKDIADQYRVLSGSLESRRSPDAPPASPDLSRIQSAITLADEDLRHVNTLSAQVATLQHRVLSLPNK